MASPAFDEDAFDVQAFDVNAFDIATGTTPSTNVSTKKNWWNFFRRRRGRS